MRYNPSLRKAVKMPEKRLVFLRYMRQKGFEKTVKKFFGGNLLIKLKRFIKDKI